ncbi:hypothetical protein O1L60_01320 [Streptomyces diastatochromogenes]|nr:hypothetical protein [Streptomyces diastatochromogenes]
MKITKVGLSACAVAALLTGAVACTDGGGGTANKAPRAISTVGAPCANGTYTWSSVGTRDVLTGVAEKQTLGKGRRADERPGAGPHPDHRRHRREGAPGRREGRAALPGRPRRRPGDRGR